MLSARSLSRIALPFAFFVVSAATLLPRARAANCPDDLPLEKLLPGTTFELVAPLQIDPKNYSGEGSLALGFVYFIGGKVYEKDTMRALVQKNAAVFFVRKYAPNPKTFDTGRISPTACRLLPFEKDSIHPGSVQFRFAQPCALQLLYDSSQLTLRDEALTLGQLRESLGSRFVITPLCAPQTEARSDASEKKAKVLVPDAITPANAPPSSGDDPAQTSRPAQ